MCSVYFILNKKQKITFGLSLFLRATSSISWTSSGLGGRDEQEDGGDSEHLHDDQQSLVMDASRTAVFIPSVWAKLAAIRSTMIVL